MSQCVWYSGSGRCWTGCFFRGLGGRGLFVVGDLLGLVVPRLNDRYLLLYLDGGFPSGVLEKYVGELWMNVSLG